MNGVLIEFNLKKFNEVDYFRKVILTRLYIKYF